MTTKDVSRMVVWLAVLISGIVLVMKLLGGAVHLLGGVFDLILGVVIVCALAILVIWMFHYAKTMRKK